MNKLSKIASLLGIVAATSCVAANGFAKGGSKAEPKSSPKTHQVREYTKKDGARVRAHRQTNPNRTQDDNYSVKGNVNPETGKEGTKPAGK